MIKGTVYELFSPNCNKTYIGSTTKSLATRLNAHRYRNHPLFDYGEVDIRVLEQDIPKEELRKREGKHIRERINSVFNTRVAGRTQRERYYEDVDSSRAYHRQQYTPKRAGGDGNYRQLNRYKENKDVILRDMCIRNAYKYKRLPTKYSQLKYCLTKDEIADILKHINSKDAPTSQD